MDDRQEGIGTEDIIKLAEKVKLDEVIKVLKNERKCVERQISALCDRNCAMCNLVLPDDTIIDAYDKAISILRALGMVEGRNGGGKEWWREGMVEGRNDAFA